MLVNFGKFLWLRNADLCWRIICSTQRNTQPVLYGVFMFSVHPVLKYLFQSSLEQFLYSIGKETATWFKKCHSCLWAGEYVWHEKCEYKKITVVLIPRQHCERYLCEHGSPAQPNWPENICCDLQEHALGLEPSSEATKEIPGCVLSIQGWDSQRGERPFPGHLRLPQLPEGGWQFKEAWVDKKRMVVGYQLSQRWN